MFKGRGLYILGLVVILIILFGYPVFNFFNKEPTCFDGKQNGAELGVDCGGLCTKVCSAQTPAILWARSFEVRSGVYNSMAMIENPNGTAGAFNVPYTFRLFDRQNVLVYERKGITDIPPQTRFPVFEGRLITGERLPHKTFFEFNGNINWQEQNLALKDLRITNRKTLNLEKAPRIEATLENRGVQAIKNLEVFAVVYDNLGNAINTSNTLIDEILPDSSKNIVFTWPQPFTSPVQRVEILPKFQLSKE